MSRLFGGVKPPDAERHRRKNALVLAAVAILVVFALAAVGCGGDDDDGAGGSDGQGDTAQQGGGFKEPIKVGAIFTVAGAIDYSAAPAGAQAYFARLNQQGGINGRKVELIQEDDGGDPSAAAAAARRMLGEDIVAMVGNDSTVDCPANDALYRQRDIISFISLGSNPVCFASPNQVPIQKGAVAAAIQSASIIVDEKKKKNVVYITFDAPSGRSSAKAVEGFLKLRGALGGPSEFVQPGKDPTASIARVARRNPDGIVVLATFPVATAILQGLAKQGITEEKGVAVGCVLTCYEQNAPEVLQEAGEGLTLPSDFLPLQAQPEPQEMKDWKAAMNEVAADKRLGGEAQAGWIAADLFTEVVKSIDGEVTPESVSKAFRSMPTYDNDMLACPIEPAKFQGGIIHRCDHVVRLEGGEWQHAEDEFGILRFPPQGFKPPTPQPPQQ